MIVQVEKFMRKWNMVPEGGRVLIECRRCGLCLSVPDSV